MNSNLQPVVCLAILTAAGLASGCRTLNSYVQADSSGAQRTYLADSSSLVSENRLSRYTREFAPVDLNADQMRRVIEREGGCIVWGGNVRLSPADDLLIRVERHSPNMR